MARAVLRADGSAEIGLGHLMRSVAVAEALLDRNWDVILAAAEIPTAVSVDAEARGLCVYSLSAIPGGADDAFETARLGADVVIVDGYHFNSAFYSMLSGLSCAHVIIDDNAETQARIPLAVINPNPHARRAMYSHLDTVLLLGLEYALIRSDLRRITPEACGPESESVVLVALGGSDPLRLTVPLVEALHRLGMNIRVALGPSVPQRSNAVKRLTALGSVRVVAQKTFAMELAHSELAVVGAATMLWEAAYLGIPTVGLIVADNQVALAHAATRLGFSMCLDVRAKASVAKIASASMALQGDANRRGAMKAAARALVDGRGPIRIAEWLTHWLNQRPARSP